MEAGALSSKEAVCDGYIRERKLTALGLKYICCLEGKQMECRPWSDLPVDILNLIIGRLPTIVDQIRFRFVCKNWHLAKVPQNERNIPWLLSHRCHFDLKNGGAMTQLISFHIPSPGNQYHLAKNIVKEEKEFFGAGICASKYGWLLLQQNHKAFFYSPYSRKAIKLPNMVIGFNRATFSSSPTSPDCICFSVQSSKSSNKIKISICSPGDLEWCTVTVDGFRKAVEDVVYHNGNFYCVFSGGVLGTFCVASRDWSVLTDMEPVTGIQFWSRSQLVESNGEELLLVCHSVNFHVFSFDWSEMVWKKIHKLGNQTLFLGCTSFAVAVEGKTSALSDRIYYHGDGHRSYFYHMLTDKKYACNDFYPWVLHGARERVWIEPPSV